MRIISGTFRGKKILEPINIKTRPLKDLVKESIFNIIHHSNKFQINLNNSLILDLFSGIGSFGLECLSRGVKSVIFVENYEGVLPILKKNLESLKTVKKRILERQIQERRDDDNEEVAIKRYNTYEKSSSPVIEYYEQSNLLKVINGEASISEINSEISGLIEGIKG